VISVKRLNEVACIMKSRTLLWGLFGASLLLIVGLSIAKLSKPTRTLVDYGALPNFSLIDQNGSPVTLKNYAGHIWVADMIFTHCGSVCPIMTSKMFALQTALKDQPDIRLASISVDPKHDAPDTLKAYAEIHHADPARWSFLTGKTSEIYRVAKDGFHLPLDSVGGDQDIPIIHSPKFALVDTKGRVRGYYYGIEDEARKQILADIDVLKNETSE